MRQYDVRAAVIFHAQEVEANNRYEAERIVREWIRQAPKGMFAETMLVQASELLPKEPQP